MNNLLEMLGRFHAASGLPFPFDRNASGEVLNDLMENGYLAFTDGGLIGGKICPAWANPAWTFAIELFWWAEDGSGLSLLRGFEDWAREQGANEVRMTSLESLPRASGILSRRGYEMTEHSYGKVL